VSKLILVKPDENKPVLARDCKLLLECGALLPGLTSVRIVENESLPHRYAVFIELRVDELEVRHATAG